MYAQTDANRLGLNMDATKVETAKQERFRAILKDETNKLLNEVQSGEMLNADHGSVEEFLFRQAPAAFRRAVERHREEEQAGAKEATSSAI